MELSEDLKLAVSDLHASMEEKKTKFGFFQLPSGNILLINRKDNSLAMTNQLGDPILPQTNEEDAQIRDCGTECDGTVTCAKSEQVVSGGRLGRRRTLATLCDPCARRSEESQKKSLLELHQMLFEKKRFFTAKPNGKGIPNDLRFKLKENE